jgi:hypothetical protein
MYTGEALQKRWYQMLGNHDYQGNVSFFVFVLFECQCRMLTLTVAPLSSCVRVVQYRWTHS